MKIAYRSIIGFVLLVGLIGFAGFSTATTWTVGDSGSEDYTTIQEAINNVNTNNGDTIEVKAGIYHEDITVSKNLLIDGEDQNSRYIHGDITISSGRTDVEIKRFTIFGGGILLNDQDTTSENYINVTQCLIYEGSSGIDFTNVQNINIINCAIFNNNRGIDLVSCDKVLIESCRIFNNDHDGIRFRNVNGLSSDYTDIKDCFIFANGDNGIEIDDYSSSYSDYIKIFHTYVFENNGNGIRIEGGTNYLIDESPISNNIYDQIYCSNVDEIKIVKCHISEETSTQSAHGIYLGDCSDFKIIKCNISNVNNNGIHLSSTDSIDITSRVTDCNIMNVGDDGISLSNCDDIDITSCNILDAAYNGIDIGNSVNTSYDYEIEDCVLYHCGEDGLYIDADDDGTNYNVVVESSSFLWNEDYGIYISDAKALIGNSGAPSKCNNFLQNADGNAYDYCSNGTNTWGETDTWGNYWGDSEYIYGLGENAPNPLTSGVNFYYVDSDYTSSGPAGTYANPYKRLTAAVGWNDKVIAVDWGKYDNSNPNIETFPIWLNNTERLFARPEGTGANEYVMIDSENPARIGEPIILNQINCVIAGFKITSSGSNYHALTSLKNDCIIYGNEMNSSKFGIDLKNVDRNIVIDNTCYDNSHVGIRIEFDDDSTIWNIIQGNTVYGNDQHGIRLGSVNPNSDYCRRNTVILNTCYDNGANQGEGSGIYLGSDAGYNIIALNSLYKQNENQNKYGIYIDDASGTSYSEYNNVILNDCSDNSKAGMKVDHADHNWLLNNDCSYNDDHGIIFIDSDSIKIINNNISQNGDAATESGFYHSNACFNHLIIANIIANSYSHNVWLTSGGDNNYLILNDINGAGSNDEGDNTGNNNYGIYIWGTNADDNVLWYNTFDSNDDYGVSLGSGTGGTLIHYNNFVDNGDGSTSTEDQADDDGSLNSWDDGTNGNWWNDYDGDGIYSIGNEDDNNPKKSPDPQYTP